MMSILDRMPHGIDHGRPSYQQGDYVGDVRVFRLVASIRGWVQNVSMKDVLEFEKHDELVTHKVFFTENYPLRPGDMLLVTSGPFAGRLLNVKANTERGAGSGVVYAAFCEEENNLPVAEWIDVESTSCSSRSSASLSASSLSSSSTSTLSSSSQTSSFSSSSSQSASSASTSSSISTLSSSSSSSSSSASTYSSSSSSTGSTSSSLSSASSFSSSSLSSSSASTSSSVSSSSSESSSSFSSSSGLSQSTSSFSSSSSASVSSASTSSSQSTSSTASSSSSASTSSFSSSSSSSASSPSSSTSSSSLSTSSRSSSSPSTLSSSSSCSTLSSSSFSSSSTSSQSSSSSSTSTQSSSSSSSSSFAFLEDSSGNEYHGTLKNFARTDWTSDAPAEIAPNRSLTFNGSNQWIDFEDLGFSGNVIVSIEAWVKLSGSHGGNFPAVIDMTNTPGVGTMLALTVKDCFPALDFGTVRYRTNAAISQDSWYHIVLTKRPGLISGTSAIYIDGAAVACTTFGPDQVPNVAAGGANNAIGRLTSTAEYFEGKIARLRVYDVELSLGQVVDLYNQDSIQPSPVAEWLFNDD